MTPVAERLSLVRLDFSAVGDEWAVLRLLARLEADFGSLRGVALAAGQARLIIDHGEAQEPASYLARACQLERRRYHPAWRRRHRASSELLWRATFVVPLTIVHAPHAVFALTPGEDPASELALALPALRARIITPQTLALAPVTVGPPARSRFAVGPVWQRLAALTTAAALAATSSPAVALAAGVSGAGAAPTPASTALAATSDTTAATSPVTTVPATTTPPAPTVATPATTTPTVSVPATTTPTVSAPTSTTPTVSAPTVSAPTSTTPTVSAPTPPAGAPTTTATPIALTPPAPTSTRRPHRPRPPAASHRPASCASRTGGGALAPAAVRYVRAQTGLARRVPASCVPTVAPTVHRHPAIGHPRHGATKKSARPANPRGQAARPTGGAPLQAPTLSSSPPGEAPAAGTSPSGEASTAGTTAPSPAAPVSPLSFTAPGFLAPRAWTGTVTADPSLTGAVRNLSGLLANGDRPPSFLIPIYMQAGTRYDVPWPVLAAINAIESDYGRDLSTSSAGAVGWMQFEPATWREYGVAADGHSVPNPYDPRDAIFAAARYLKAAGASHDVAGAVYAYNHAGWYVDEVMARAPAIASHVQYERAQRNRRGTFSVFFATGLKRHPRVRYSGGLLSHMDRLIAAANMVSAANFPYLYGGGHEQPAHWGPFDCSGSVSYVVQQAGYQVPTTVSGDIPIWKFPAGPGRVTIFYNPGHTFMRIGNRFFGTSGFARPGGGAGWFDVNKLSADYLATFREVHIPRLGVNSFAPDTHSRPTQS